jgi:uncharacterized sulfatase
VELLDIYPTLAELCGLTPPENLEGKSLRPLLENPAGDWDKPAITQVMRRNVKGRSIRTEHWRYTEWDKGEKGVELYDHKNDPREHKNLALDPKYSDIIRQLQELLPEVWRDSANGG